MFQVTCPICFGHNLRTIGPGLLECSSCRVVINAAHTTVPYDDSYFIEEYKNQYGRTYLEDFTHIYALAQKRLYHIAGLMSTMSLHQDAKSLSLLDIGSAMGFFLKCAKDQGIGKLKGIEISEYAAHYCQNEFGIEVINSAFTEETLNETYDIITSWFFIEHCQNFMEIIKWIYAGLNKDGIFACAVPSVAGPSYIFHRDKWIAEHPVDHAIDLSPHAAKKLLKKIGFKKIKVIPAGFHPERIISSRSVFFRPFAFFYKIFSRITAFSDTIEIYARK